MSSLISPASLRVPSPNSHATTPTRSEVPPKQPVHKLQLRDRGILNMRSDIVTGAVFPDYELSDHTGKRRKLSELQQHDPMIVVLSRGAYCPKDRRQHEGLVQLHRELEVGYCRLVTISTGNLIETNEFRTGVGAHWPF